jgi:2,4-dienoyl-CoA reductase-like NADH-dependent reductase (Old Yellow Enzyme family)
MRYEHVLAPIQVGGLTLKNRVGPAVLHNVPRYPRQGGRDGADRYSGQELRRQCLGGPALG